MFESAQKLDKLEIAQIRLQDLICNYFAGNAPVSVVEPARAIGQIVRDMSKHLNKKGIIPLIDFASDPFHNKNSMLGTMNERIRLRSNFAKHADQSTLDKLDYSEEDAVLALHCACVDFQNFVGLLAEYDQVDIISCEDALKHFDAPTRIDVLIQIYTDWATTSKGWYHPDIEGRKEEIYQTIREFELHRHGQERNYALLHPAIPPQDDLDFEG